MIGQVYLVGAGPGDPDLITVKGLRVIQQADVILYDRLIPLSLLDEAHDYAILINVGKAPTKHRFSQDEINQLIVTHAQAGRCVARLKGGDPFVFGRGSEEALICQEHGIPFEVVPGISSSYAVPAYAGIPMTHRNLSSSFTVITGHEDPTKSESMLDYAALVRAGGTLVVLMGVKQLARITSQLIQAELDPDTPAAIIEKGTTPQQRVITGTVGSLAEQAAQAGIKPPATTIIGGVVGLRDAGVNWFELEYEKLIINGS